MIFYIEHLVILFLPVRLVVYLLHFFRPADRWLLANVSRDLLLFVRPATMLRLPKRVASAILITSPLLPYICKQITWVFFIAVNCLCFFHLIHNHRFYFLNAEFRKDTHTWFWRPPWGWNTRYLLWGQKCFVLFCSQVFSGVFFSFLNIYWLSGWVLGLRFLM